MSLHDDRMPLADIEERALEDLPKPRYPSEAP